MIKRNRKILANKTQVQKIDKQRQRGAIAVEYALWLPILMAVVLLVFELLRVVVIQSSLTFALADAARGARLKNDLTALQQQVSDKAGKLLFVDRAKLKVSLIASADNAQDLAALVNQAGGHFVIYEVSYPLSVFSFNGWSWANATFRQRYLLQRED